MAALVAELTNRRYGARRRTDAVVRAGGRAVKRPRLMATLIGLLADPGENVEVRRAALSAIEAGSFKTVEFRRYAAEFREALRVAATDDDVELRTEALDVLALHKDSYAQQLLVDGLRNPRTALVKPVAGRADARVRRARRALPAAARDRGDVEADSRCAAPRCGCSPPTAGPGP